MPSRDYHEAIWEAVPENARPSEFELRRDFLLADVRPGDRVLDLGCGAGEFAAELRRAGARVLAADVAEEPLRRARLREAELDLELLAPEGAWDLPDAHFDVVWAGEVIEHVSDTAAWLSEVRRVLRSGGLLLLSTPHHGRLARLHTVVSERAFAEHFDPLGDHLRFYTPGSLRALICSFGFESVSVRRAGGRPWSRRSLLTRAVRSRF